MKNHYINLSIILLCLCSLVYAQPGSEKEPLRYTGQPKTIDQTYHDGQLRPVVGVHSYQVLRANRTNPPDVDNLGYTYNHAPMMAYWKGKFYLEYLALAARKLGKWWEEDRVSFLDVTLGTGRIYAIIRAVSPARPVPVDSKMNYGDV